MAEGNSKSRSVLGDLTNRVDKTRISGKQKVTDLNDEGGAKRVRFSPHFGTEIDSLERNVSKVQDENRNRNLQCLDDGIAVSRSSIDVDMECNGSDCLKGENGVMGSSNVHGEKDGVPIFGLDGRDWRNVIGSSKVHCGSEDIANLGLERREGKNVAVGSSKVHGGSDDIVNSGLEGEGETVLVGSSKVHSGNDDIVILGHEERDAMKNVVVGSSDIHGGSDDIVNSGLEGEGKTVLVGSSKVLNGNDDMVISGHEERDAMKNFVVGSSDIHGASDDIVILGLGGRNESQSNMDSTDINVVGTCGKIDCFQDVSTPMTDKIARHDDIHSDLTDVERARVNGIVAEADGCGKLKSSKGPTSLGISQVLVESKCSRMELSVGENVADFLASSSKMSNKKKDEPNLVDLSRSNDIHFVNVKAKGELHDSIAADSFRKLCETSYNCPYPATNRITCEVNKIQEGTGNDINVNDNEVDGQNADNFIMSQSSSTDPESCEYGEDGPSQESDFDMSEKTELLRACSCSFCTKAGCVLLDLYRQDIKDRISAIRKSQKEAVVLAGQSCRNKVAQKHGVERNKGVGKTESHLMNQWRSLFQSMAGILEKEGNGLEASLQTLPEPRGKSKADSELIGTKPQKKH